MDWSLLCVDFGITCVIRCLGTLTWPRPCARSVHWKLFGWIQQNGEVRKRAESFMVQSEFFYSDLRNMWMSINLFPRNLGHYDFICFLGVRYFF